MGWWWWCFVFGKRQQVCNTMKKKIFCRSGQTNLRACELHRHQKSIDPTELFSMPFEIRLDCAKCMLSWCRLSSNCIKYDRAESKSYPSTDGWHLFGSHSAVVHDQRSVPIRLGLVLQIDGGGVVVMEGTNMGWYCFMRKWFFTYTIDINSAINLQSNCDFHWIDSSSIISIL